MEILENNSDNNQFISELINTARVSDKESQMVQEFIDNGDYSLNDLKSISDILLTGSGIHGIVSDTIQKVEKTIRNIGGLVNEVEI